MYKYVRFFTDSKGEMTWDAVSDDRDLERRVVPSLPPAEQKIFTEKSELLEEMGGFILIGTCAIIRVA